MSKPEIRVQAGALQAFTAQVFTQAGLPPEDAAIEAEVLVWANLRGVDSHGVLRIPWYLDMVDQGLMNPRPDIRTLKDTPAVLFVDADRAFGPVVTVQVMQQVMEKARTVGIGWGLIRNLTHQGAMAYYALMAAEAGLAGIAIVCSPPNMAPFGARAAGLHNSPISIAVPAGKHRPVVLDMATSVAAGGKLTLAADKRIPLPAGWALDGAGNPTTDPNQAQILLPAGGPKGSGLALMFQCLTSLMADNPLLAPVLRGGPHRHNQNSVVAAIDISLFLAVDTYTEHVDNLIDELKALPTAEGFNEVLMPGEPEEQTYQERTQNGIPLPPGTVEKLEAASRRFNIPLPAGL
jgi:LDH2 family malate/lactate/ureidoglycolate dehydrogenase